MGVNAPPAPPPDVRRVTPTAAAVLQIIVGLLIPCFFVFVAYARVPATLLPTYRLFSQGQVATGKVYSLQTSYGTKMEYLLEYSFDDDAGVSHQGEHAITADQFYALKADDPVAVTYLATAPEVSCPSESIERDLWHEGLSVGLRLLLVGAILACLSWRCLADARLNWWLAKYGRLASATVTRKWYVPPRFGKGGHREYWEVAYELTDETAATYPGQYRLPQEAWDAIKVEAGLPVLYNPKRPGQSLPVAGLKFRIRS